MLGIAPGAGDSALQRRPHLGGPDLQASTAGKHTNAYGSVCVVWRVMDAICSTSTDYQYSTTSHRLNLESYKYV
jgi:hypothetical protein